MSQLEKTPYEPLLDLVAAKQHPDGIVVLEGDYGGVIYATCPVRYLAASHDEISSLCKWLEYEFWGGRQIGDGGWAVHYEATKEGSGIWGGMGGGKVIDGLWTHHELDDTLSSQIPLKLKITDAPSS